MQVQAAGPACVSVCSFSPALRQYLCLNITFAKCLQQCFYYQVLSNHFRCAASSLSHVGSLELNSSARLDVYKPAFGLVVERQCAHYSRLFFLPADRLILTTQPQARLHFLLLLPMHARPWSMSACWEMPVSVRRRSGPGYALGLPTSGCRSYCLLEFRATAATDHNNKTRNNHNNHHNNNDNSTAASFAFGKVYAVKGPDHEEGLRHTGQSLTVCHSNSTHIHFLIGLRMYVCMYVRMYVCVRMYICMYIYIYI